MAAEWPQGEALVQAARDFASAAHRGVGQLRKYTGQPYDEHLRRVAEVVATVTDDPEMQAAAWLHDVVEDTPVTIEEVGRRFGPGVRELVDALTDVSRPQDGNRVARKALDRAHLARAPARAQTVKLADLIDNCADICKHDPGFGRVFVAEMASLLEVLQAGDPALQQRARKTLDKWAGRLSGKAAGPAPDTDRRQVAPTQEPPGPDIWHTPGARRALRFFARTFTAADLAEVLPSFDAGSDVRLAEALGACPLVGVREAGSVTGYALRAGLGAGCFADHRQAIAATQRIDSEAGLADVVQALTRHDFIFVTAHGHVMAYIGRAQMQGPVARMWLFGMITSLEMLVTEGIRSRGTSLDWSGLISPARLDKARVLQAARADVGRPVALLDCLQLSDKLRIAQALDDTPRTLITGRTKAESQRLVRDLEDLRNSLAHAQDIVSHDWSQIARLAQRLEELARGA